MSVSPVAIAAIATAAGIIVLLPAFYFIIIAVKTRRNNLHPPRIHCNCGGCACGRVVVPMLLRERLERRMLEQEIPNPPRTSTTEHADHLVKQLMGSGNSVVGGLGDKDAQCGIEGVVVTGDGVGYVKGV